MWFDGKIGTRESIKYIQVYVNYFPHSVKIMGMVSQFLESIRDSNLKKNRENGRSRLTEFFVVV